MLYISMQNVFSRFVLFFKLRPFSHILSCKLPINYIIYIMSTQTVFYWYYNNVSLVARGTRVTTKIHFAWFCLPWAVCWDGDPHCKLLPCEDALVCPGAYKTCVLISCMVVWVVNIIVDVERQCDQSDSMWCVVMRPMESTVYCQAMRRIIPFD